MARWATTLALVLALGATATFAEELTSQQGRGLQGVYYGFPWCSCGNRDASVSPISISFDHYWTKTTPGKAPSKYACFYLSVDPHHVSTCKECANMDVGKIEWLVKADSWNTDCTLTEHHLPIPGSWGQVPSGVPYKANVLKCTNLKITQADILAHNNQFEVCFNIGYHNYLSDFSGFASDQITAAIFEPSTKSVCCPTITTAVPFPPPSPPPPVCFPPPPKGYDPIPTPKPYDPVTPSPKPYVPTPTPVPSPKPYDPVTPSPKPYVPTPTPVPSPKPYDPVTPSPKPYVPTPTPVPSPKPYDPVTPSPKPYTPTPIPTPSPKTYDPVPTPKPYDPTPTPQPHY